jgi:hypothetical protein
MYRIPASFSQDPSLRRAIALAVALCSFGAGFLMLLLNELPTATSSLIGLAIYFGLLAACWYAGTRGWVIVLYALAALGLAITSASIAMRMGVIFHFTPRSPWRWSRLIVPGVALLVAPFYIRRFWKTAGTHAGQG